MLAALLQGEGLGEVASLAAAEAGTSVAIVVPGRGVAVASDPEIDLEALTAVARQNIANPDHGFAKRSRSAPVIAGATVIGFAIAFGTRRNGQPSLALDPDQVLEAAALAALTALAMLDARDEAAGELRGSLLEDVRTGAIDGPEIERRASRMGCSLEAGAVALAADVPAGRARQSAALVAGEHPGALAEPLTGPSPDQSRLLCLLPAAQPADGEEVAASTVERARRIARRLRSLGPTAVSSWADDVAEIPRAVREAELMLDVMAKDERLETTLAGDAADGVYRLLFRALASDPEEVRRFFSETVEPLVSHDRDYHTDLIGTLESYLANDCNMNATAAAVYAHRHTVAHRLNRIKELCDLDPSSSEDRERLGLGLKAYRIIEPTLPR